MMISKSLKLLQPQKNLIGKTDCNITICPICEHDLEEEKIIK